MPFVLNLLGSKAGGWLIMGLICAILGGTIYVQGLRIDALKGKLDGVTAQRDQAKAANDRLAAKIQEITDDKAAADARANKAVADLAAAKSRTEIKIANILREVQHAASDADKSPFTPAERAALGGLRDAFPGR